MKKFIFESDLDEDPKERKIRYRVEFILFCIKQGITSRQKIRKLLGTEHKTICSIINTDKRLIKYSQKRNPIVTKRKWDGRGKMDWFNLALQLANTSLNMYKDNRKNVLKNQIKKLERTIIDEENKDISKRDHRIIDNAQRELYILCVSIANELTPRG